MGLFSLFRSAPSTDHAALLSRYKHLRQLGLDLNNRLVATLSKDVLHEGGRRLGILRKNVLVFDSMDQTSVLMDYCIHDVRRGGKNAIERFLEESPPPADSAELMLLQALRDARYALLLVEEREQGVGARVHDMLRDETLFLHDIGFGSSCVPGMLLASRIMCVDDMWMTTGAALPFGMSPAGASVKAPMIAHVRDIMPPENWSAEQAALMSATIIRECLQRGAADHIVYRDAEENSRSVPTPQRLAGSTAPKRRVGTGNMCRCGSGRKFKHCCGKRR